MVHVLIDLTDTSGYSPALGDTIEFEARSLIGSHSIPGRVITTAPVRVELRDGLGEVDLEPGPHVVRIKARNYRDAAPLSMTVPDPEDIESDTITFRDLMDMYFDYSPSQIGEAQQYMVQARGHADRAETAADRVGSAEDVQTAKDVAVQARDETLLYRNAASTKADEAAQSASNAASSASDALSSQDAASVSANAAAGSATTAETEADRATTQAVRSETAADVSRDYNDTAWTARTNALTAMTDARTARDDAQAAATDAEGSALAAESTVTDATNAAVGAAQSHADRAETAETNSVAARNQSVAARDRAETAAQQAETIGTGNLPDATSSSRGLLQMTGDLAGTGADPRVPGLSLTAPGAQVDMRASVPGWGNAQAHAASNSEWVFDGEYISAPDYFGKVHVFLDWCGGSSVSLRGRRRDDGTVVTIGTIDAGTPENHRSISLMVDLDTYSGLAVGATWTQEDIDAECDAHIVVQPIPEGAYSIENISGLSDALDSKLDRMTTPNRLYGTNNGGTYNEVLYASADTSHSIAYRGTGGRLKVGEPTESNDASTKDYVDTELDALRQEIEALRAIVFARPAMWMWDGVDPWVAPEHAVDTDNVLNTDAGEIHAIEEEVPNE